MEQSMLETVIPKSEDSYVFIVRGPYKLQVSTTCYLLC